MSIYSYKANLIDGSEISLEQFKGKVLLIVNTASRCGFTPQYKDLEKLYQKYKDKGLVILGFPCNQFGNQESGSNKEIQEFCDLTFKISFLMFEKVKVNGKDAHPLYRYLKSEKGGWLNSSIKWNFTKFLINSEGIPVHRFPPAAKAEKIEKYIKELL